MSLNFIHSWPEFILSCPNILILSTNPHQKLMLSFYMFYQETVLAPHYIYVTIKVMNMNVWSRLSEL